MGRLCRRLGSIIVLYGLLAVGATAADHSLPAPYSALSWAEVTRQVFPSYDSSAGTVAELETVDHKPAGIAWEEAKTWYSHGQPYLVVIFAVNTYESRADICGVCPRRFAIAVVAQSKGQLHLIARGLTQQYGGHRDAQLDLAPYRLSDSELLIGLRVTHIWSMVHAFNTRLELYRLRNRALNLVFRTTAVDRQYPDGMEATTLSKLKSTISMEAARPFYTLRLDRTAFSCRNIQDRTIKDRFVGTDDCDVDAKTSKEVWRDVSQWKFDGHTFVRQDLDAYLDEAGN